MPGENVNKLSHSAINTYLTCGKKYELHYKERLRGSEKSSALIFGSAIDLAINALLLKKEDAAKAFIQNWTYARVSGEQPEFIPTHVDLRYAESDFDKDLLTEEDYDSILKKALELNLIDQQEFEAKVGPELVDICIKHKKDIGYNQLSKQELQLFNYINWLSLARKAPYMLAAYEKIIVPRIKKIHAVQKRISLNNADGDMIDGYIDLIIDYEMDDGKIVKLIADNKTSTIEYAQDAVSTSQQLTIYCIAENITHGAFFVMRKQLNKNKEKLCKKCGYDGIKENKRLTTSKTCDNVIDNTRCHGEWIEQISPEARIDIRVEEIKELQKQNVIDTMDQVNSAIKAEVFPRNYNSCYAYGQKCVYFDACHKGDFSKLKKEEK